MMNVIRGQVSENLRRVLDAPPPSATQTTSACANSLQQQQQQPQPRPPPIPASSGLPSHQAGNLDVVNTASGGGDRKAKFGAKEFVRLDEDEFLPDDDSASCNNVTKAACGGAAPSCRAG